MGGFVNHYRKIKNIFSKNYIFLFVFPDLDYQFLDFWQDIFGRVFKTALNVSRGTFREKKIIEKELGSWFFSDFARKIVRQGFHNCILRVQKNILINNFFFEIL